MRYFKCPSFTVLVLIMAFMALPVGAQVANPEAMKLAKNILEANHSLERNDQVIAKLTKIISDALNQANPGKSNEVNSLIDQVVVPEFRGGLDLLDQNAQIYANNFTLPELKQLLAFYQSDIGRKLVDKQPEIVHEQGLITQAYVKPVFDRIKQKLLKAIDEKGLQKPNNF